MSDFFTHHFYAGARVETQAGAAGKALEDQGLEQGRMISASKGYYDEQHPDHEVFFNACVFIREPLSVSMRKGTLRRIYRQVWWGDIDLTLSLDAVGKAADVLGRTLWITRERYRWNDYHGEQEGAVRVSSQ